MRILHVVQPPRGGALTLVDMLVHQQVGSNEVGVVCRPGVAPRLARSGARVWALPMVREISPADDLRHLIHLTRIVRRFKPDVLHAHSSKAGALGRLSAWVNRVPAVFSPHNFAHLIHESSGSARLFLLFERVLAPLTDQLHLAYEGEREDALRRGLARPGQVTVIPNGIDTGPLLSLPGPAGDPPTIGTYARLWPQKRVDLLLRALSRLARQGLAFRVIVIGDGPLRDELERLAADLGLGDRTRFLDDQGGPVTALAKLDIYVLSSAQESFPLVPMEAMAAGRPVVATAVGALPEIVEDGVSGMIVPPGDEPALAEAISRLITEPSLRQSLGSTARVLASERFEIAAMAGRMEELYRAAVQ